MKTCLTLIFAVLLTGCLGTPEGIRVVQHVDAAKYSGTWYEIARLDHSFERGLEQVSATYSAREDGGIKVLNRGYHTEKQEWREAEGKAYFIDPPNADGSHTGKLKVSFFGPFYGAYNIIELDKNYQYVMLCGADYSYFWILSRTPHLDENIKARLLEKAKLLGFDTNALIYVKQ
jgi:apolipoprotein D and lipocalin family protein